MSKVPLFRSCFGLSMLKYIIYSANVKFESSPISRVHNFIFRQKFSLVKTTVVLPECRVKMLYIRYCYLKNEIVDKDDLEY